MSKANAKLIAPAQLLFPTSVSFTTHHSPAALLAAFQTEKQVMSQWFGNTEIAIGDDGKVPPTHIAIRVGRGILVGWGSLKLETSANSLTIVQGRIGLSSRIVIFMIIPIVVPILVFAGAEGPVLNRLLGGAVIAFFTSIFIAPFVWLAASTLKDGIQRTIVHIVQINIEKLKETEL